MKNVIGNESANQTLIEKKLQQEEKEQQDQKLENDTNNEKQTDSTESNHETFKVISNTDRLNRMPQYTEEGKACKAINNVIERGDCFQTLHEHYLLIRNYTPKEQFYFPYVSDQSEIKNIFYFPIGENDQFEDMQEEEHFSDYIDPYASSMEENYQRGLERTRDFWYVFSSLIPRESRLDLTRIYWTDTGEMYYYGLGKVYESPNQHYLMVSHNAGNYYSELKFRMIHEFAHLLTMNNEQVDYLEFEDLDGNEYPVWAEGTGDCSTYITRDRCIKEDSYMYRYFQQFWLDTFEDWMAIDWNSQTDYKDFFDKNEAAYFNSYQGTSPVEDIADAFAFFVFTNSKEVEMNEDLRYKKLQFFYQFDEFVKLRTAILENLYDLSVKDQEFY